MDSDEENWRVLGGKHPLEYALMVDLIDEFLDMMGDEGREQAAPVNMIFPLKGWGNAPDRLQTPRLRCPCHQRDWK